MLVDIHYRTLVNDSVVGWNRLLLISVGRLRKDLICIGSATCASTGMLCMRSLMTAGAAAEGCAAVDVLLAEATCAVITWASSQSIAMVT